MGMTPFRSLFPEVADKETRVATAPTFGELWPKLTPMLEGAEFLAAHWATARFTACRRNSGGRQHLDVLQQYAGAFVRTGVGIRRFKDGTEVPAEAFPTHLPG